jgi:hypothetical protein
VINCQTWKLAPSTSGLSANHSCKTYIPGFPPIKKLPATSWKKNTAALMIKRFLIIGGKRLNLPNPLGLNELFKLFLYLNIIKYL